MSNRAVLLLCIAVLVFYIGRTGLEIWAPFAPPPPPLLSDTELAAALERAMAPPMLRGPIHGDLKVSARVEDGVVFISRYFNRPCILTDGSPN
ncbi:MAG: hypothetical protein AAF763_18280 [Pseudomonadota bacterium]